MPSKSNLMDLCDPDNPFYKFRCGMEARRLTQRAGKRGSLLWCAVTERTRTIKELAAQMGSMLTHYALMIQKKKKYMHDNA